MNIFLKRVQPKPLSYFSHFIDHCLSSKSSDLSQLIHAQLIKVGFNRHTYLGNRLIDLYSKLGLLSDALKSFDDIANKNIISWNIYLNVYVKDGDFENVVKVFDEIPERDIVTWNSIISGVLSNGYCENVLELFTDMQNDGIKPDKYTYSAVASSVKNARHGKQVHGKIIRTMLDKSNLVVGNALIDMYGTIGLADYAFGVFLIMEEVDVISWNSLISSCFRSGNLNLGLTQFGLMISHGYSPDEFTVSTMTTVCTSLQDLKKDWRMQSSSLKKSMFAMELFVIP